MWKTVKYSTQEIETKAERENIPSDYLTWYKERKMEQSWSNKKFGHPPSPYYTYEEIAKRKAKKVGEDWFGNLGGKLAAWWVSQGIDESKKKEVDWTTYANDVYSNAFMIIFWGFILFWLVYGIILSIVLHLVWREPKLIDN